MRPIAPDLPKQKRQMVYERLLARVGERRGSVRSAAPRAQAPAPVIKAQAITPVAPVAPVQSVAPPVQSVAPPLKLGGLDRKARLERLLALITSKPRRH